MANLELVHPW